LPRDRLAQADARDLAVLGIACAFAAVPDVSAGVTLAAMAHGASLVSTLVLASLLAWWYLQLCFFRITRSERDRTEKP
jgi:hypothetical protein